ncbi:MAG: aspartate carbamoyltransferase regulatory subunit [Candidatus Stygibacter australis]|nr:aspartate carbamoyltransferase regulatory subunit [Candidatus Stygibacter australis]MDP8321912.1 aspartate carbamoyltransferase regulatory subunit [Candidatus Stygibacter australis]
MKKMKVRQIENGAVIDHIAAGKALYIAQLLHLVESSLFVIGSNLQSSKFGKKDIIKIENYILSDAEKHSIALISPRASFVQIQNYDVISKETSDIPDVIEYLIVCPNLTCITNTENMSSRFDINKDNMTVRCAYCEKKYTVDEVKFKRLI